MRRSSFPFTGSVEFVGLERGPRVTTQPAALRKSYCAEVVPFATGCAWRARGNRCHYVFADTSQPWGEVLSGYLASRQHTGY